MRLTLRSTDNRKASDNKAIIFKNIKKAIQSLKQQGK